MDGNKSRLTTTSCPTTHSLAKKKKLTQRPITYLTSTPIVAERPPLLTILLSTSNQATHPMTLSRPMTPCRPTTILLRKIGSPSDQPYCLVWNSINYAQNTCSTYQTSKTCTKPNTKHPITILLNFQHHIHQENSYTNFSSITYLAFTNSWNKREP